MKKHIKKGVKKVRDRRRRTRQRLEEIFNRKVFVSVLVVGALGKMVETGLVQFIAPNKAVDVPLFAAWTLTFLGSLFVAVYWERLARAAEEATEQASETVENLSEEDK